MNAGELFVKIGVLGANEVNKTFDSVKSGLGDIRDMSFEAKAGIVGAMYAIEEMMRASINNGNKLQQIADATGLNTEELQKYAWAATKAGVSTQEFYNSAAKIPNQIMDILQGNGQIATAFKKLLPFAGKDILDYDKLRGDKAPEYIMQWLSRIANNVPKDFFRHTLNQAGFSDAMVGLFNKGTLLDSRNFQGAPVIGKQMSQQLQSAHAEWARLGIIIEHIFDKMSANHGVEIAKNFERIAVAVGHLVDSLLTLSEKTHIFTIIEKLVQLGAFGTDMAAVTIDEATGSDSKKSRGALPQWAQNALNWRDKIDHGTEDQFHIVQNMKDAFKGIGQGVKAASEIKVDVTVTGKQPVHPENVKHIEKAMHKALQKHVTNAAAQARGSQTR